METVDPTDTTVCMLTQKIEKLQKQLVEVLSKNERLKSSHDRRSLGNFGNSTDNEARMPVHWRNSLVDQLKVIDKRSGHGLEPLVNKEHEESFSSLITHSSRANNTETLLSPAQSGSLKRSRKSVTSWGLLSLTQKSSPKKTITKKWSNPLETLPPANNSLSSVGLFHDSLQSFANFADSNDLSVLFRSAASFYEQQKEVEENNNNQGMSRFDGHKSAADFGSFMPAPGRFCRKKWSRRFSDGGASPAVQARKQTRHKPKSLPDPLANAARLLAADEEISAITKEVEEKPEMELPWELTAALRDASLQMASTSKQMQIAEEAKDAFHSFHSALDRIGWSKRISAQGYSRLSQVVLSQHCSLLLFM